MLADALAFAPVANPLQGPLTGRTQDIVPAALPAQTPASVLEDAPQRLSALTPADDFGPAASYSFAVPAPRDGLVGRIELQPLDAAVLRTAVAAYRKGDLSAGDAAAAQISDPLARSLAEWSAIRLRPGIGFRRISGFAQEHPGWPTQGMLRRKAEEAFIAETRAPQQIERFFATQTPLTLQGKIAIAGIWMAGGRAQDAATLMREAWRREEFAGDTETKILSLFPGIITEQDHRLRAERYLLADQWVAAQRNAARAGDGVVKLAKARIAVEQRNSKAQAALDAVPVALRTDPSFAFSRAQFLRRKDRMVEAARALDGVTRDATLLANAEAWWTERRVLARELLDRKEHRLAYEVVAGHPLDSGAVSIDGAFHAGWIALRFLNEPDLALRHFTSAAQSASTPISIARGAYWQGRAAEASQDEDIRAQARSFFERAALHPTTYYGQLATHRLGVAAVTIRSVPRGDAAMSNGDDIPRAVSMLYQIDARDLAIPLITDMAKTGTDAAAIDRLAERLTEMGDARALLVLGKTASQRGLPVEDHAFPMIGVPDFTGPVAAVEKPLVLAIARQESAFDPKAVSAAGARGLMQLMPATAKMTASRAGLDFAVERLTSDAGYNALIGASHLGDLVAEWRGSYILTMAAYNAGSGNVKRWIDLYGDPRRPETDPVDWVERIPFTETRNYVQRVMENLQVYRSRIDERAPLRIVADLRRGVSR